MKRPVITLDARTARTVAGLVRRGLSELARQPGDVRPIADLEALLRAGPVLIMAADGKKVWSEPHHWTTIEAAAHEHQFPQRTIRNWARNDKITATKIGNTWHVDRADVAAMINNRRNHA